MLGELIEVFNIILQIVKGEIPLTLVYTVIFLLIAVSLLHIVSEVIKSKGKINLLKLMMEGMATSIIIFVFYMGVYLFIFKIFHSFINTSSELKDENLIWYTIISFFCFITLFSLFYLYKKFNLFGRLVISAIHILLTVSILTLVNKYLIPQSELPISAIVCTLLLNLGFSIFFITFGTESTQKGNEGKKVAK
ncbi:hypothetical protein [Oceanobacillus sp. AG]|uniref:hypothetical protein n=1 Tax=Oceanobacillus sp. AG TaxID=2681969 RepID=UPI0012EB95F5|nr:hypothetical protein [Oceanobacillus sp. AG]